ncbi:family 20 glycosylhydrolase [Paenibacillus sp. CMAA1364]
MNINITGLGEQQILAISDVAHLLDIQLSKEGVQVQFSKTDQGIFVSYDGSKGTINFSQEHQWMRALGLFIEKSKNGVAFEATELPVYDSLSIMIDCSRNAVIHFDAYKKFIQHISLMGYSAVQLYTEDTFEMEEYPYFGYMRGRYTSAQLKEMDQYALRFGIELVPCIQTLAHLEQPLKWKAFADIVDCNDILLVDDERTYEFIDAMFRTLSENLTSRTINIGMDEAHMMGLGKYLDKHGYQDRMSIMMKHFNKVMEIARRYGYRPMMWSDMFFRLASAGEYYDVNSPISEEVIAMIPEDITFAYWDYYSEKPEIYDAMMKKHKQMSDKIVFAGGAWKWMGFTPNNEFSKYVSEMAHESCKTNGIKDVLMTAWGDNGAEASIHSILPSLQLWAELCYEDSSDPSHLAERFETCVGGNYEDFMALDMPNLVPDNTSPGAVSINPPKYLLYQDILTGLFDKHVIPEVYAEHYRKSAEVIHEGMDRNPNWKALFETQYALCKVLELKCDVGINIRQAYLNKDDATLTLHVEEILPELKRRTEDFMTAYRTQWNEENKIFGLDVFDIRMGGLLQRMEVAVSRLSGYLSGQISQLEELEQEILYFDSREEEGNSKATSANLWNRIATPSVLAGFV